MCILKQGVKLMAYHGLMCAARAGPSAKARWDFLWCNVYFRGQQTGTPDENGCSFNNGVLSEFSVNESAINRPKNIRAGEFKESKCEGLGIRFDDGFFKISTSVLKPLPAGDLTFMAWVRIRNTDSTTTIYSTMEDTNGGKQVLEVRPSTKNRVNGFLKWTVKTDKTSTLFSIDSEDTIPSGMWTHVIAKYDGKQGRAYLFINSEKVTKDKDAAKAAKLPWGSDIVIGGLTDEAGKVTFDYTGGMLGIRFVEKPLTDAEIKSEYDSCKPQDADTKFDFPLR
ncbi:hypothetical protein QZH41_007637 [Actinostola sp. cb2023]|nr:hypothetical protein QZH41_007637 [Actinostola sp. cb2023]